MATGSLALVVSFFVLVPKKPIKQLYRDQEKLPTLLSTPLLRWAL